MDKSVTTTVRFIRFWPAVAPLVAILILGKHGDIGNSTQLLSSNAFPFTVDVSLLIIGWCLCFVSVFLKRPGWLVMISGIMIMGFGMTWPGIKFYGLVLVVGLASGIAFFITRRHWGRTGRYGNELSSWSSGTDEPQQDSPELPLIPEEKNQKYIKP